MENTVSRMAKILGASGVESAGHDARFVVEGAEGGRLRVSLSGQTQRFMAVLQDAAGVTRATVDVAPVTHVVEDPSTPGRVTLQLGRTNIHIDSQPTLAIEMVTVE